MAWTFYHSPSAGGDWAGGAVEGSHQAVHPLKKVSYIVVISVVLRIYFCSEK